MENEKPKDASRRRFLPTLVIGAAAVAESSVVTSVATHQYYEKRMRDYEKQIQSYEERLASLSKRLEEISQKVYLIGISGKDTNPSYMNLYFKEIDNGYVLDKKVGEGFSYRRDYPDSKNYDETFIKAVDIVSRLNSETRKMEDFGVFEVSVLTPKPKPTATISRIVGSQIYPLEGY